MPFNDGSGPNGEGPVSGRGAGNCVNRSGADNLAGRRSNRFGRGRRFRNFQNNDSVGFDKDLDSLESLLRKFLNSLTSSNKEE